MKTTQVKIAYRKYECRECGNQVAIQTNHKIDCYPNCTGKCRQILNAHTAREIVMPVQTAHKYLKELAV